MAHMNEYFETATDIRNTHRLVLEEKESRFWDMVDQAKLETVNDGKATILGIEFYPGGAMVRYMDWKDASTNNFADFELVAGA